MVYRRYRQPRTWQHVSIRKALRSISPGQSIAQQSMEIIVSYMKDVTYRLLLQSREIMSTGTKKTLNARDIQFAVRLQAPGELSKHAVVQGIQAVTKANDGSAKSATSFVAHSKMRGVVIKSEMFTRVSKSAMVYLAAVVEYFLLELIELAVNMAVNDKKKRIFPRHILQAVRNDEELDTFFNDVIIPGGGVLPSFRI